MPKQEILLIIIIDMSTAYYYSTLETGQLCAYSSNGECAGLAWEGMLYKTRQEYMSQREEEMIRQKEGSADGYSNHQSKLPLWLVWKTYGILLSVIIR